MTDSVRVLLVEDSPLWIEVLGDLIRSAEGLTLIAVADDGQQAVEAARELRPDIVLMDCHLPGMSGLDAVERIMADAPTPILCMTSDPTRDLIFQALDRGALEILPKPDQLPVPREFLEETRRRLAVLSRVPVVRRGVRRGPGAPSQRAPAPAVEPRRKPIRAVGIVASTGGPVALRDLLRAMVPPSPPVVVVQHMTPGFVEGFARWLNSEVPARIAVASQGEPLASYVVLLAPDGVHSQVAATRRIRLVPHKGSGSSAGHVPSGDVLLRSFAVGFGSLCAGVVLTGMGKDGCAGLADIHRAGGSTLAQDKATSTVWGMPREAVHSGAAARSGSPQELGLLLSRLAREGRD